MPEVDAAREFAHDHQVQAADHLGFQCRGPCKLRVEDRRSQVGEQPEAGAQSKQPLLGAQRALQRLPLWAAYGPQQYRVGCLCLCEGLVGQWLAVGLVAGPADRTLAQLGVEAVMILQAVDDLDGLANDLRTDPVTRKYGYLMFHYNNL